MSNPCNHLLVLVLCCFVCCNIILQLPPIPDYSYHCDSSFLNNFSQVSYTKIFLRLRQHQLSVQGNAHDRQPNGGRIPLNIALYKKTVVSIALVQVALFVCYVPFIISLITIRPSDHDNSHSTTLIIVREAATTIFYLNSSLNPFLYFWRMKELRQVVKAIIKRVFSCLS